MLLETRDGEGGVTKHVGLRYPPERHAADGRLNGYYATGHRKTANL